MSVFARVRSGRDDWVEYRELSWIFSLHDSVLRDLHLCNMPKPCNVQYW